jgi:putative mRNA 3-end processing factor
MSTLSLKKHGTGIVLEYGEVKLALDTGVQGVTTLLSHSHTDHIGRLDRAHQVIGTKGTFDTFSARGGKLPANRIVVEYQQMTILNGVNITAINAGHVLGSTMFLIEYGSPSWIFPSRVETHENIVKAAANSLAEGVNPLFNAYSLGKAQEVIALLQDRGINVVSGNRSIDEVCKVYNRHGFDLKQIPITSKDLDGLFERGCAIVTSSPRHTEQHIRRMLGKIESRAIIDRMRPYSLSGWTLGKFRQRGFPLSAHSDYLGLLEFAKGVDPKIVYCFTENAREFSGHLAEAGLNAVPLE